MIRILGPPPAIDWWDVTFAIMAAVLAVREYRNERRLWAVALAVAALYNLLQSVGLA